MKTKVISTSTKIVSKLSLAVVGLAIFFVLWIGYLLFTPVEVLEVRAPIPATPTEVQHGGTVNLNFDYCKYKDLESHIKIDFIGEYIIPTLSTTRNFRVGCHAENLAISIPSGTPEGVYTIRMSIEYQANMLREEYYVFDSVDIKVINNDEKPTVQVGDSEDTR